MFNSFQFKQSHVARGSWVVLCRRSPCRTDLNEPRLFPLGRCEEPCAHGLDSSHSLSQSRRKQDTTQMLPLDLVTQMMHSSSHSRKALRFGSHPPFCSWSSASISTSPPILSPDKSVRGTRTLATEALRLSVAHATPAS